MRLESSMTAKPHKSRAMLVAIDAISPIHEHLGSNREEPWRLAHVAILGMLLYTHFRNIQSDERENMSIRDLWGQLSENPDASHQYDQISLSIKDQCSGVSPFFWQSEIVDAILTARELSPDKRARSNCHLPKQCRQ